MRRISPSTVIASVALFLSLTGSGFAAGHYLITSLHQIAPKVRVQLRGAVGPTGPQGIQGPAGPQGTAGPQGPPATQTRQVVIGDEGTLPPGAGETQLIASCPHGTFLTGGGYQTGSPGATISGDYPDFSDAIWIVRAENPGALPVNIDIRAVCEGG